MTLIDQYKQTWNSTLETSPKALNYKIFKNELKFESYLNVLSKKDSKTFCRFRTCNHSLPIEKGRWINISRENRICTKCNRREVGDEFHYILNCSYLRTERKKLSPRQILHRNVITFNEIMSNKKQSHLRKLCSFIRKIKFFATLWCILLTTLATPFSLLLFICPMFKL